MSSIKVEERKVATPFCRVIGNEVQFFILLPVNGDSVKKHGGMVHIYSGGKPNVSCNVVWLKGSCDNQITGFFGVVGKCKIGVAKITVDRKLLEGDDYTGRLFVDGERSDVFKIAVSSS